MEKLALPLIFHVVAWMKERYSPPLTPLPPVTDGRLEPGVLKAGKPCPSPAATLSKVGPVLPHPGSTVDLTLMAGVQVSWSQECEHGRVGSVTCLPCSSMDKGEMLPFPLPLGTYSKQES